MPEHRDQSPPAFTPIQPVALDPEDGSRHAPKGGGPWLNRVILGLALGLLFLCLVGVIFVLPRFVEHPATPASVTAPEIAAKQEPDSAESDVSEIPTPEKRVDPEIAEAQRESAQSRLAELLRIAEALEAKQVKHWAKSEYEDALAAMETGEKAYREQRYEAALETYDGVLGELKALQERVPEVVNQAVDDGYLAIVGGDSAAATEAFEFALAIEPDHRDAEKGLARAKTLDQVLALVAEAQGYERLGDLDEAMSAYERALGLDAQAPDAVNGLARVQQARTDRRYREAMSEGFAAFNQDKLSEAISAFEKATEIKPHADEAAAALRQSRNLATSRRIETTIADAERLSGQERWSEAAEKYRAALKLDDKLPTAAAGNANAKARAKLDEQLRRIIEEPLRLSDNAVFEEATAVLERAASVADPGPRLRQQIATLGRQLEDARTPINVTLRSDELTDVVLYKFGKLGPFDERELALVPGRYTVVGTRDGYRDTRIEFTVMPNLPAPSILVQCEEKIAFGN
jgi:tetratricopeptide (TPR) repeat protein